MANEVSSSSPSSSSPSLPFFFTVSQPAGPCPAWQGMREKASFFPLLILEQWIWVGNSHLEFLLVSYSFSIHVHSNPFPLSERHHCNILSLKRTLVSVYSTSWPMWSKASWFHNTLRRIERAIQGLYISTLLTSLLTSEAKLGWSHSTGQGLHPALWAMIAPVHAQCCCTLETMGPSCFCPSALGFITFWRSSSSMSHVLLPPYTFMNSALVSLFLNSPASSHL